MQNRLSLTCLLVVVSLSVVGAVAPDPPQNLSASVAGNTVTLTWNAPSTGSVPAGYVVEASLSPGGVNVASLQVGGTFLTVPNVPNGVFYVRVRSVNADGASSASNEVVVAVPSGGSTCAAPPNAPSNAVASVVGNLVTLGWTASSAGCPATAFVVQAGSAPGASNVAVLNVGGATSVSAAASAGRYYARVIAINNHGGSAPSNEVIIDVGSGATTPAPSAPVSLIGTWRGTVSNYVPRPGTGFIRTFLLRIDANPPAVGAATRAGLWQDNLGCVTSQVAALRSAGNPAYSIESLRCADGDVLFTIRSVSGNTATGTCSRGANCTFQMTKE